MRTATRYAQIGAAILSLPGLVKAVYTCRRARPLLAWGGLVLIAGASPDVEAKLADFGFHIGIVFQIADDLFDYTMETPQLGKQVGAMLDAYQEPQKIKPHRDGLFKIYGVEKGAIASAAAVRGFVPPPQC